MGRVTAVAAIIGVSIAAAFGWTWLSLAAGALPGWRAGIEVTGLVVLGAFLAAGVTVILRVMRAAPQPGGERLNPARLAWFGVVIPAEVALIAGGQRLLEGSLGHPEWIPTWTLFVVGAHFVPFAVILRIRAFHKLAGALCAVAVVSALIAGVVDVYPLWGILPGFGGAIVLWLGAGWALARMARGQWPVPGVE